MSFIKKGIKAIGNFIKKYWKEIVMVAAVVFTAGIATVGAAGFSAAMAAGGGGVGGFFSAVGSTMWAGVTATAGSMGIGSGAAVGEGTAFAAANIAGGASHVGLGAAMGAGGGYGLGTAGKAAAAAAEEAALAAGAADAAAVAETGSAIGVEGTGIGTGAPEATRNMAAELGAETGTKVTTEGTRNMAADLGKKVVTDEAGMSMGKAMLYGTAIQTGGSMLQGYAQGKAMEEQMKAGVPDAYWGVATKKGAGRKDAVDNYLFEGGVMQPLAGDVAGANEAADAMFQEQMGGPAARAMSGSLMTQPGQPLQFAQPEGSSLPTSNPNGLMALNPNRPRQGPGGLMQMAPYIDDWRLQA